MNTMSTLPLAMLEEEEACKASIVAGPNASCAGSGISSEYHCLYISHNMFIYMFAHILFTYMKLDPLPLSNQPPMPGLPLLAPDQPPMPPPIQGREDLEWLWDSDRYLLLGTDTIYWPNVRGHPMYQMGNNTTLRFVPPSASSLNFIAPCAINPPPRADAAAKMRIPGRAPGLTKRGKEKEDDGSYEEESDDMVSVGYT